MTSPEEPAKNWQIQALRERLDDALKRIDRIDTRADSFVTSTQLEERVATVSRSLEGKIANVNSKVESDKRETNLKYGPLLDNSKWLVRGIVTLILAQLVFFAFNALGGR